MTVRKDEAWFEPKTYGYGAGLPVHWKGWALLAIYLAVMLAPAPLLERDPGLGLVLALAVWFPATLVVVLIARRKTRGGWRMRSGDER